MLTLSSTSHVFEDDSQLSLFDEVEEADDDRVDADVEKIKITYERRQ